jgi:hypothetical protein
MRWEIHVARKEYVKNSNKILVVKAEGTFQGVYGRILLKRIVKKWNVMV